jgi:hypothetical protein
MNRQGQPADWAFLAMAQHRLGKKDEAETAMNRLRQMMKDRAFTENKEAKDFQKEAEITLRCQGIDRGFPVCITTTVLGLAVATSSMGASWPNGSDRSGLTCSGRSGHY